MNRPDAIVVGIDVSKKKVDVYVRPQGKYWTVSQDQLAELIVSLKALQPKWIVLEPTGGYEMPLVNLLNEAGLQVARPHVTRMSYHAKGSKQHLTKTDKLDAKALAHYAECYQDELRAYSPQETQETLRMLYQRQLQLTAMRTEEKNRLSHQELSEGVRKDVQEHIDFLTHQIEAFKAQQQDIIVQDEKLKQKQVLLQSMVGIGQTASMGLLALMPELGEANRKQIAALAGVVPIERSSGKHRGQACIRGGRFAVRQLLYMSALCAIRYCPLTKAFYERLRAQGKSGKQAVVACMHKMLRILNALVKKGEVYKPV